MKKVKTKKRFCTHFAECQLHKHGAFQDNNKKSHIKDQHQIPNYLKTESNLNKIINTGIVLSVILGYTVKFVRQMLDLVLFSDCVKPSVSLTESVRLIFSINHFRFFTNANRYE